MKETQRHIDAYNLYFSLRNNGMGVVDVINEVGSEFGVSDTSVYRWMKEFDWKGRESIDTNDVQNKVAEKRNEALADNKAWYLSINHKMIRDYEQSSPQIENLRDYDALIKTNLQLQGDNDGITTETNELLKQLIGAITTSNSELVGVGVKRSFDDKGKPKSG